MAYCPSDAIIVTPGAQGFGHLEVADSWKCLLLGFGSSPPNWVNFSI